MPDFQKWIDFLESKGYSNYWQDLNAKDYGVAQNRDRCFMVSILGKYNYKFPQPIQLEKTMKDYLEDEVDEKYYINTEKAQKLIYSLIENGELREKLVNSDGEVGKMSDEEYEKAILKLSGNKIPIDLSVNKPNKKTVSNCITAKDRSISNQRQVGNGVIEWKLSR